MKERIKKTSYIFVFHLLLIFLLPKDVAKTAVNDLINTLFFNEKHIHHSCISAILVYGNEMYSHTMKSQLVVLMISSLLNIYIRYPRQLVETYCLVCLP